MRTSHVACRTTKAYCGCHTGRHLSPPGRAGARTHCSLQAHRELGARTARGVHLHCVSCKSLTSRRRTPAILLLSRCHSRGEIHAVSRSVLRTHYLSIDSRFISKHSLDLRRDAHNTVPQTSPSPLPRPKTHAYTLPSFVLGHGSTAVVPETVRGQSTFRTVAGGQ
jgi:hypothetical protein